MKKIRIYGAGGHSQVIKEMLEMNEYEITQVFDDDKAKNHRFYDKVSCGVRSLQNKFPHSGYPFVVAIGNNKARAKVAQLLLSNFEKVIHPTAIVSPNSRINDGSVIMAGAIVQTNSIIGRHVIINTGASIDHDNLIEDFVHISPKSVLCGNIKVKEGAHIGAGAVILPNITIGKWAKIGAGTIVLEDVPDFATVVGVPGRIIKFKNF